MIDEVTMAGSTWAPPPHKFEAGTPPIAQAVGLGAAVDYLTDLGMRTVHDHEQQLTGYLLDGLSSLSGLRIVGPTDTTDRGGAVSFVLDGIHPHDVGQLLDQYGIAVRVGHHCARPACLRYGVPATTRASLHLYSSMADVDALVRGLDDVKRFFSPHEVARSRSRLRGDPET
jgi:cysteine desulfurase/selenocysteine lyase